MGHFVHLEQPFPKSLLRFTDPNSREDDRKSRSLISPRITELPENYRYASAAHLCPIDYLSHCLLPAALSNLGLTTITLDPGHKYMHANAWEDVVSVLPGLTALHISEEAIRNLFEKRTQDLWEMAETLSHYDCPIIVIKRGKFGQFLFIKDSPHKYQIPAYPTKVVDPTGVGDAFCGGFLAGFKATFDPLQAVMYGNVSASLTLEGVGPFYGLESLPGLAQARLETLPEYVQKI
ncbi:MAG: carbohydrate kinase family protein [Chloroflexota bacterium]